MTKSREIEVTCPRCQKPSSYEIWDSVNVTITPELREKVLMGELFAFKCKSCGQESNLFYPFLYHDMEHRFWIQIVINPEDDFEYAPNLLPVAYQTMKDYRSRLVSHLNDVKEKILIFEDSLDDRAVEIVKLLLRRNMMETENRVLDGPLRFYDLAKDKQGHPTSLVLGYFPVNGEEEIFPFKNRLAFNCFLDFLKDSACAFPLPSAIDSAKLANRTVNQSHIAIWNSNKVNFPLTEFIKRIIVVRNEPIATIKITGFFIKEMGFNFLNESKDAFIMIL